MEGNTCESVTFVLCSAEYKIVPAKRPHYPNNTLLQDPLSQKETPGTDRRTHQHDELHLEEGSQKATLDPRTSLASAW